MKVSCLSRRKTSQSPQINKQLQLTIPNQEPLAKALDISPGHEEREKNLTNSAYNPNTLTQMHAQAQTEKEEDVVKEEETIIKKHEESRRATQVCSNGFVHLRSRITFIDG